jgi:hypothetical protein
MRRTIVSQWMLLGISAVALASLAACSAKTAPTTAGAMNNPTATPAASAAATPKATMAASPPAGAPSATPTASGGIENLVITSAEKNELTLALAAWEDLPVSDISGGAPDPGSVYYAYEPATNTYWALATFTSGIGPPNQFLVMFWQTGLAGPWHVAEDGTLICGEIQWFGPAVLAAWSLPTTPPPGVTC